MIKRNIILFIGFLFFSTIIYVIIENDYEFIENNFYIKQLNVKEFQRIGEEAKVTISIEHRWKFLSELYKYDTGKQKYVLKNDVSKQDKNNIIDFMKSINYIKLPLNIFYFLIFLNTISLMIFLFVAFLNSSFRWLDFIFIFFDIIAIFLLWLWGYIYFTGAFIV